MSEKKALPSYAGQMPDEADEYAKLSRPTIRMGGQAAPLSQPPITMSSEVAEYEALESRANEIYNALEIRNRSDFNSAMSSALTIAESSDYTLYLTIMTVITLLTAVIMMNRVRTVSNEKTKLTKLKDWLKEHHPNVYRRLAENAMFQKADYKTARNYAQVATNFDENLPAFARVPKKPY